jgi:hypothetical protein
MMDTYHISDDFQSKSFEHYNDFSKIFMYGRWYHLGSIQAKVVKQLYIASFTNYPWVCGKTLLYKAGSGSLRMRDLFKSQNRWQELIISDNKGNYCLRYFMDVR